MLIVGLVKEVGETLDGVWCWCEWVGGGFWIERFLGWVGEIKMVIRYQ